MKLRDALLCIDCDEVFTAEGSACNARCPRCGSQVSVSMTVWLPAWNAYDNPRPVPTFHRGNGAVAKRRRMKLVHATPIAA